jgi:hypothetical protein
VVIKIIAPNAVKMIGKLLLSLARIAVNAALKGGSNE